MVPKSLRYRVMEVAHDSMFGGHLGTKKTRSNPNQLLLAGNASGRH